MEFISRIFFHRFFSTSIPGFFKARNTYKQNTLQVENIMLEKYPGVLVFTLPKTNSLAPEKLPSQKETIVFQPSIFRCYVSFREGNHTSFPWSRTWILSESEWHHLFGRHQKVGNLQNVWSCRCGVKTRVHERCNVHSLMVSGGFQRKRGVSN